MLFGAMKGLWIRPPNNMPGAGWFGGMLFGGLIQSPFIAAVDASDLQHHARSIRGDAVDGQLGALVDAVDRPLMIAAGRPADGQHQPQMSGQRSAPSSLPRVSAAVCACVRPGRTKQK